MEPAKKLAFDPSSAFNDRDLPENKISAKRALEIEEKAKPWIRKAIKKLKKGFKI